LRLFNKNSALFLLNKQDTALGQTQDVVLVQKQDIALVSKQDIACVQKQGIVVQTKTHCSARSARAVRSASACCSGTTQY